MLTVDFDRLGLRAGERVLDMGCGAGRHAFEMYRRGADVIALDQDADELADRERVVRRDARGGRACPPAPRPTSSRATRSTCPSPTASSTASSPPRCSSTSPTTTRAIAELVRVLRPGGTMAVTVPRWLPEKVCWALSRRVPRGRGRPRPHLPRRRAGRQARERRAAVRRPRPRPRAALAVLVGQVRRRRQQRRATRWSRRSTRCSSGTSMKRPLADPARREGAQPAASARAWCSTSRSPTDR